MIRNVCSFVACLFQPPNVAIPDTDHLYKTTCRVECWLPNRHFQSPPKAFVTCYTVDSHQSFEDWILCVIPARNNKYLRPVPRVLFFLSSRKMSRHIQTQSCTLENLNQQWSQSLCWFMWPDNECIYNSH